MKIKTFTNRFAIERARDFRDFIFRNGGVSSRTVFDYLVPFPAQTEHDRRHWYFDREPKKNETGSGWHRNYRNQTIRSCYRLCEDEIIREGGKFYPKAQSSTPKLTDSFTSVNQNENISPVGENSTTIENSSTVTVNGRCNDPLPTPPPPNDVYEGRDIFNRLGHLTAPYQEDESDCHDVRITLSPGDMIPLLGDLHMGSLFSRYFDTEKFLHHVDDFPLRPILMGDIGNRGSSSVTPGNSYSEDMGGRIERECEEALVSRIGDKIITWVPGNHEYRDERTAGKLVTQDMYEKYITDGLKGHREVGYYKRVYITVGDQEYYIFIMHKLRGFSQFNPCHGAFKILSSPIGDSYKADVVVGAHTHKSALQVLNFGDKERTLIMGGSYLNFADYGKAISADYRGSPMPMIAFTRKGGLVAFRDYEKGMEVMGYI